MQKISRKALWRGLGITLGVSIISLMALFAFTASDEMDEIIPVLSGVPAVYVISAVLSIFSVWVVQALRIEVLARSYGQPVGMAYALKVYLTSSFVAHVTPFSSGGIPIEIYLLYRRGISIARSSAIILVQGSMTALVLLVASPILIYLWRSHLEYAQGANIAFIIVLLLVGVLLYVMVRPRAAESALRSILLKGPVGSLLTKPGRREKTEGIIEKAYGSIQQFSDSIFHLWREQRGILFLSLLLTILYWACYLSVVPIIIKGLGLEVNIVNAIVPQLVFNLFQAFIPTPGGSGGAELGFASMYIGTIPKDLLASFILLWRFMTFYLSLFVGGVVALAIVRDLGRDETAGILEE